MATDVAKPFEIWMGLLCGEYKPKIFVCINNEAVT